MTLHTNVAGQRRDIALEITTKILAELERGVMPWRKPWDGARTGLALPRRATGENYRGVNVIMLWSAAVAKGYASPYWITLRQALLLIVSAIERRHLPHLSKRKIEHDSQTMV